jgi:hypothetical protein
MKFNQRLVTPFFALAFTSCAVAGPRPAADNYIAPATTELPPQSLIVILPIVEPAHDFTQGEVMALGQLQTQMVAAGYRVAALDKANYELVWRQESEAAGGVYDPATGAVRAASYARAISNLAQRVCQEAHCTLLLRYRLVLRQAEMGSYAVEWDGQRRQIPTSHTGGADGRFSGTTDVISLELLAMTASGEIAFKMYGGASLPYRANMGVAKLELRKDLFKNDSEIADAVRLAIAPIVPRPAH